MANPAAFTILLAYTCSIFCHLQGVQLGTPTMFLPLRRVPILMSTDHTMLSTACWHTNNQITTTSKHQHAPKKHTQKTYLLRSSIFKQEGGGGRQQCWALQHSIRGRAFLGFTIMYVLHDQHRNRYLFHKISQPPQESQNSGAHIHQIALLGVAGEGNGQQIEAEQWQGYDNMPCPCFAFWDLC
jgi:hypothetical protein